MKKKIKEKEKKEEIKKRNTKERRIYFPIFYFFQFRGLFSRKI